MKTLNYIVLVLSIIFVLLFTSIEIVSVLKPLYEGQYKSNKVYDVAYVKAYPVAQVTDDIILYLADMIEDMNQRGFFKDREHVHMIDVKFLFDLGKIVRLFSIIIIAYLISRLSREEDFVKKYRISYIGIIGMIVVVATIISKNFSAAFVKFHHIFFNNDYWILYPSESIIINLMPERFFMSFTVYIGMIFAALSILFYLGVSNLHWRSVD